MYLSVSELCLTIHTPICRLDDTQGMILDSLHTHSKPSVHHSRLSWRGGSARALGAIWVRVPWGSMLHRTIGASRSRTKAEKVFKKTVSRRPLRELGTARTWVCIWCVSACESETLCISVYLFTVFVYLPSRMATALAPLVLSRRPRPSERRTHRARG